MEVFTTKFGLGKPFVQIINESFYYLLSIVVEDALTLFDVGNLFDCVNGDSVCCAVDDCVLF